MVPKERLEKMDKRINIVGSSRGALLFGALLAIGGGAQAIADLGVAVSKTQDSAKRFSDSARRFRNSYPVSFGLYYDRLEEIPVWTEEDKKNGKATATIIRRIVSRRYNPRLVFSSDLTQHSAEGHIPATTEAAYEMATRQARAINSRRGDYKRDRFPGGPRVYVKAIRFGENTETQQETEEN